MKKKIEQRVNEQSLFGAVIGLRQHTLLIYKKKQVCRLLANSVRHSIVPDLLAYLAI